MDRQQVLAFYAHILDGLSGPNRLSGSSVEVTLPDEADLQIRVYLDRSGVVVGAALEPAPERRPWDDTVVIEPTWEPLAPSAGRSVTELLGTANRAFGGATGLTTCELCGYVRGFPPCPH